MILNFTVHGYSSAPMNSELQDQGLRIFNRNSVRARFCKLEVMGHYWGCLHSSAAASSPTMGTPTTCSSTLCPCPTTLIPGQCRREAPVGGQERDVLESKPALHSPSSSSSCPMELDPHSGHCNLEQRVTEPLRLVRLPLCHDGVVAGPNLSEWHCDIMHWVTAPCDPLRHVAMPRAGSRTHPCGT